MIAKNSPHLSITSDEQFHHVTHNGITMPLLKSDTLLLPILNVTIEEMSQYLLEQVLGDYSVVDELKIHRFEMRVSSSTDQWGTSSWSRE